MVVGELTPQGGLEGLVVTAEVADEHGVESLDQINADPALIALFDGDGDGRAEIFGCPSGEPCHDVIDDMITFNRWNNLEQVAGPYGPMVLRSRNRVDQGEPVIQYVYTPSGFAGALRPGEDVRWLSMGGPEHLLDGSTPSGVNYRTTDPVDLGPACTAEPCHLGWSWADIRITANRAFVEANPPARALFEQIEIPLDELNRINAELGWAPGVDEPYNDLRVRAAAERWLQRHRDEVEEWLTVARAAG